MSVPGLFGATAFEIQSINGGSNATAGTGFSVVVRSVNGMGNPTNVGQDTGFVLSLDTGTGILGGTTLTGTITNGSNSATVTGVTYTKAETGVVLLVTQTSGEALASDTASFNVNAGAATQVVIVQQPGNATSGAVFGTQPIVEVQDANGNCTASGLNSTETLTLSVQSGGGTLLGTASLNVGTGATTPGRATFTNLRIDLAGSMVLRATVVLGTSPTVTDDSDPFTVAAGSANHFVVTGSGAQQAGASQTVTITAEDAAGNVATGFTGAQTLVFSGAGDAPGGTKPTATDQVPAAVDFGSNTTVLFASGVGTSSVRLYAAGSALLVATQGAVTTTGSDRLSVTVSAASATVLVFTTSPAGAVAGAAFTTQPVVATRDQYGNPSTVGLSSPTTVTMTLQSGSGTLQGTATGNVVSGSLTFSGLRIDSIGSKTLRVSATLNAVSAQVDANLSVTAGAAKVLVFDTAPAGAVAGSAFTTQPVVVTQDDYGNPSTVGLVSPTTVTISIQSGTGTLQGTAAGDVASGSLTFSGLRIDTSGSKTLRASATLNATSATVDSALSVSPTLATRLFFSVEPSGAVSGAVFTGQPTVVTQDQFGNPSTVGLTSPTTLTMSLSAGTGPLQGTLTGNIASGSLAFTNLRLDVTGTDKVLQAEATLNGTSRTVDSAVFSVTAGTTTRFVLTGTSTQVAGGAQTVTIRAVDASGNTTPGYTGARTLVFSGASLSPRSDAPTATNSSSTAIAFGSNTSVSFSSGVATTSVILTAVETANLIATQGALTTSGADRLSVTVSPASATRLAFTQLPSGAVAGADFTTQPTVVTQDQFGNPSTVGLTSPTTLSLSLISGTGPLQGTTSGDVGSGSLAFTDLRLDVSGSGRNLQASATLNGSVRTVNTGTFTVSPTTATVLAFSSTPSGAVAGAAFTGQPVVVTRDQFGNASTVGLTSPTTVTLSLIGGTGPLQGTLTGNVASGSLTFSGLRIDVSGSDKNIQADAVLNGTNRTATTGLFSVSHATAHHLVVQGGPSVVAAATTLISLRVEDSFGNLATSFTQSLAITLSGLANGSNNEAVTLSDTGGVARAVNSTSVSLAFSGGVADVAADPDQVVLRPMVAGTASVTATGGSLIAGTPLSLTVTAGAAAKLIITGVGDTTPNAGEATTVTVVAQDAGGNTVTVASAVNLSLASSPTSTSLRVGYTAAQIAAGTSTTTINGVILDRAESGASLTVSDVSATLVADAGPTMDVQNDVPVLSISSGTLTYAGGSGAVAFGVPGIAVTDVNSAGFSPYFANAIVRVSFHSGVVASEDILQVRSAGTIIVTGTTVAWKPTSAAATTIGTISGGLAGTTLQITMAATPVPAAAMTALLENLCYHNLGGASPTTGQRVLQLDFDDQSTGAPGGAKTAAFVRRTVDVVNGNALPVLTANTGLTVTRGSTTLIADTNLHATDDESLPGALVYTVAVFPVEGSLLLGSGAGAIELEPGGVETFTQADIIANLLRYRHDGGSQPGDTFSFVLSDGTNQLPLRTFAITLPGAGSNPTLFLPSTTLVYQEDTPATVFHSGAPFASGTQVSDPDTFDFANGTLTVEVVDANGQPDPHPGDRIGLRSQTFMSLQQYPNPNYYYPELDYTGFIALVDGAVVHRHYPFLHYWANVYVGYPDPGGLPFPSPERLPPDPSPFIYPTCWYWGIPTPLDVRIATRHSVRTGSGGPLQFNLLSGYGNVWFEPLVSAQAIGHLIDNLTFENVSQNPPTRARRLRITLAEASPSTAAGVAHVALTVNAVNDPPAFSFPAPAQSFEAVAGLPFRVRVLASDPDLPSGTALSYSLVNIDPASAGVATINSTSGALEFTSLPTFSDPDPVILKVQATDNLGVATTLDVAVVVLAGPTAQGPLVVSDPPFESFENQALSYPLIIRPDPALGAHGSVQVTLVGDVPDGAVLTTTANPLQPVLSVASLVRPPDGMCTFGIRVEIAYGMGGPRVGFQPITLKVRAVGATN